MKARPGSDAPMLALLAGGLCAAGFVYAAPLAGAAVRFVSEGGDPEAGWMISGRQAGLLLRTSLMVAGATAVALLVSLPGAAVWAARGTRSAVFVGMLACLFVCPMSTSFGWQHLLQLSGAPTTVGTPGTLLIWSAWTWPICAIILGSAWRQGAGDAYEASRLSCGRIRAIVTIAAPALRPALIASALIVAVLLINEFIVPHSWGLIVYATEVLTMTESASRFVDALAPAAPACLAAGLLLAGVARSIRGLEPDLVYGALNPPRRSERNATRIAWAVILLTLAVPVGGACWKLGSVYWVGQVLKVHGLDLAGSLATGLATGVVAVLMGMAACCSTKLRHALMPIALLFGVLPGTVVGKAVLVTYGSWAVTRDHWIQLVGGLAARFGWVVLLAAILAAKRNAQIEEQAAVDGADRGRIVRSLRLAPNAGLFLAAGLVASALAVGDLATTVQVQTSAFVPISLVLVDKMHNLEDGYVLAISLTLVVTAIPAVITAAWAARRG